MRLCFQHTHTHRVTPYTHTKTRTTHMLKHLHANTTRGGTIKKTCEKQTRGQQRDRKKENSKGSSPSRCSCVPDQWQGILMSTDREYNLKAGQESTVSTRLSVHYDYTNRKFAMTDLSTGSRALADYKMGFKFVIRDGMCHGVQTFEDMKQMCLPEAAQFAGQYTLGSSVLIDLWDFDGPFNTTMKTAVLHDECIPVTEEIYMYRSGYISVTNSMYLNVKVGEIDDEVFRPPADCIIQKHNTHSKRTDNDERHDLWNALRQRLYIFN